MGRKRHFAQRGCLSVVAVVVCLAMLYTSVEKYAINRRALPGNAASWGQSGNFIVGYGPVREPYSSNEAYSAAGKTYLHEQVEN